MSTTRRGLLSQRRLPEEMTSEVTHTLKVKEHLARWKMGKAVESEDDP